MNNRMETKYYIVARIDGDYAWLNRRRKNRYSSPWRCCRRESMKGRS